jgi:hypothetical protein
MRKLSGDREKWRCGKRYVDVILYERKVVDY